MDILKVSSKSSPNSIAGALAGVVREKGSEDVEYANSSEKVFYGHTITGPQETPTSEKGYSFVGWYLEENLPAEGEDANPDKQWIMGGNSDDLMPGRDITLYTGWINNFTVLSNLLDNEDYQTYYAKYDLYLAFGSNNSDSY